MFIIGIDPHKGSHTAVAIDGNEGLVGAGEMVLDAPPALSARVRVLDSGHKDKTDPYDARSAAIVALRNRNLRAVALEDHRHVLRLLARRHHQLHRRADPGDLSAACGAVRDDRRRTVPQSLTKDASSSSE